MASAQWSLVAFTVLAQTAVGMTLAAAVMGAGDAAIGRSLRRALVAAIAVMAAALIVSFLHLGDPTRAVYAASRWHSSWLSREIAAAVIFLILQCATLAVGTRARKRERRFGIVLAATAMVGIALVTAMARVYSASTVPSWRGPATPTAFAVTTVLLGAAATLVVVSTEVAEGSARRLASWLVGAIALALLVKLGAAVLLSPPTVAEPAAFPAAALGGAWRGAPWAALAIGVAALAGWVAAWRKRRAAVGLALLALAAFLVAEVISRATFYASYFRLGV